MITKIDKFVIQKIREKRIAKGISQSQLSFEIGLSSQGFVGMVESGKYGKKYSLAQLNEIAKVFDCTICDLLPKNPL